MLTDKVAIVTGASAGIGLALARRLVASGALVALVARTAAKLEAVAAELGAARAMACPLDVNDRAALSRLVQQVSERFGGLDILVNNAGLNHRGPALERTAAELAAVIETNLVAPVFLTRTALPYLRPGGIVVNVASLAGKVAFSGEAAYCASKAGMRAFSRALNEELRDRGLRVVSVNPGPVDTDFLGDLSEVPDLVFSQPMSTPEQVADVILACIRGERCGAEADIPAISGKLATLGYLIPKLKNVLRPVLEWQGAAAKARYLKKKGLG